MTLKYFLYGNGRNCLKYMPMSNRPIHLKYDLSIGNHYSFDPQNLATYHQLMTHYGNMNLYYHGYYYNVNNELVIRVVVI